MTKTPKKVVYFPGRGDPIPTEATPSGGRDGVSPLSELETLEAKRRADEEAFRKREEAEQRSKAEAERRSVEQQAREAAESSAHRPSGHEVYVTGHSQMLYWWPIWFLAVGLGLFQGMQSGFQVLSLVALGFGGVFLLWWALSFFLLDPTKHYFVLTPGQIRFMVGGAEHVYPNLGISLQISRSGGFLRILFVNLLLGLGSSDLIVRTGGGSRFEYKLPNVIGARNYMRRIEDLLVKRSISM